MFFPQILADTTRVSFTLQAQMLHAKSVFPLLFLMDCQKYPHGKNKQTHSHVHLDRVY